MSKREKKIGEANKWCERAKFRAARLHQFLFSFFLDALQKCVKIVKISALEVWEFGSLKTRTKLEILETNYGLASVSRGGLSWWGIEMKLQYMYLDSALDFWPPGHSELRFFASRIGCVEMECAALSFFYE